jgi:hypothetical protein
MQFRRKNMGPVGNGDRRDDMTPAARSGCLDDQMMRIDNPAEESCFSP